MISKRIGGLCAALALSLGLSACADDYGYGGVGLGYGGGYGGGGYGGGGYGDYYGDPYADGYGSGYGYAPSHFGWYGDYYYPGTGIYVYDQNRRPYRWNGNQQRYWSARQRYRGNVGNGDGNGRGSWDGFTRRGDRNGQGNDGRQWQGRRDDDDRRTVQRGYTPGQQGYRGDVPGQRNYAPGAQGYRGTPGVQNAPGYRRDPGAQGYRGTPGAQGYRNPGAQAYRGTPGGRVEGGARVEGGSRVGGERPAAVARPQGDGGRSAGRGGGRAAPIVRDETTRPQ